MSLQVFELIIDTNINSDVEVAGVAFVDKPAIEKNFLAFSDQRMVFAVDPEQRIVSGPAMVADQLIYRKDENGEYNVFFSKDTIKEIALKFFKKDYQKNLNLFHDPNLPLEGITIFESFVSDKSRGIQPMKGFEDLPDGSWFISAKVENDQVWEAVKSGQVKGFSVEGIFSFMKKSPLSGTQKHKSDFKEGEDNIMSELKNLWNQFKEKFLGEMPAQPEKMQTEATLKDGTMVTVDKMEAGGIVMIGDAPAPAGEYEFQDGTKVTVGEGGVITNVVAPSADPGSVTDYSAQFSEFNNKLSAYDQKFTEHINAYNAMAQEFSKTKDQLKQLTELVGKIIETPTAETVTEKTSGFSSQKVSREEKLKELAILFDKIKKK